MKKIFTILLLVSLTACASVSDGEVSKRDYLEIRSLREFTGQTFTSTQFDPQFSMIFKADGVLEVTYDDDAVYTGTWSENKNRPGHPFILQWTTKRLSYSYILSVYKHENNFLFCGSWYEENTPDHPFTNDNDEICEIFTITGVTQG